MPKSVEAPHFQRAPSGDTHDRLLERPHGPDPADQPVRTGDRWGRQFWGQTPYALQSIAPPGRLDCADGMPDDMLVPFGSISREAAGEGVEAPMTEARIATNFWTASRWSALEVML